MKAGKKKWEKPQLLVLSRTTPEEAVLAGCKTRHSGGPFKNHCRDLTGPARCSMESTS